MSCCTCNREPMYPGCDCVERTRKREGSSIREYLKRKNEELVRLTAIKSKEQELNEHWNAALDHVLAEAEKEKRGANMVFTHENCFVVKIDDLKRIIESARKV